MSKTPKPSTVASVPSTAGQVPPPAPTSDVQASPPKNEFRNFTDKELSVLIKAAVAERKVRTLKAKDNALQVGQKVIIRDAKSKAVGKTGTVILARKTRCFVQLEGVLQPIYVLVSNVERV